MGWASTVINKETGEIEREKEREAGRDSEGEREEGMEEGERAPRSHSHIISGLDPE